ncbi:extracellular solute-binding protein [Bacillus sp. FJAT-50079]|nr:extracellular solute-binding protein [Bacillus sp. FJAT-50079]MBS4208341.1 extracellular solute-binding protein [Bacillus sp. FJAT-50079]
MLVILNGCSSNDVEPSLTRQNEKTITLRLAWWGEQPRHDYMMKVIERYEEKNPHIHIEPEYANWDDYWKRIAPMAAANQLPDIVQMDLLYLNPYASNELLEDLKPYIEEGIIDIQFMNEDILIGGVIDKQLYGFPLGMNAPAIFVDPALLYSAEGSLPTTDWTWDDFKHTVIHINQQLGIYGTNGMKPPEVFFPYYLRTKGERFFNEEGNTLGYDDDQFFIDYFTFQLQLVEEGAFPKPDVTEKIKGIADELLVNQQAAMSWGYSNQIYGFLHATDRSLELYPPPGPNQNDGLVLKPSMLFSIAKSSTQKEEAAKFIDFFLNDIEANQLIKGERGVPISSKVTEAVYPELDVEQKKVFDYVNSVMKNNRQVEKPDPLGAIQVISLLQDISEQILFIKITPEEAAKQFREEANHILSNK